MADALEESTPAILAANAQDMADAEGHISAVMLDRLRLDEGRIRAMADGVRAPPRCRITPGARWRSLPAPTA